MELRWQKYKVTWQFRTKLCGSFPLAKDMIAPWLDARKPAARPDGGRSLAEITEEAIATLPTTEEEKLALEERTTLGFQRFEDYLVMRGGTVRAHMKDCARVLSSFSAKPEKGSGQRSFAVRVVNLLYVDEYWIQILKNGKPIKMSDGTFDKAVHVMTPQGQRNALKRIHYVENPTLIFHLNILATDRTIVSQTDLEQIMDYGQVHGYAGERGDGEGRYQYEIEPVGGKKAKYKV